MNHWAAAISHGKKYIKNLQQLRMKICNFKNFCFLNCIIHFNTFHESLLVVEGMDLCAFFLRYHTTDTLVLYITSGHIFSTMVHLTQEESKIVRKYMLLFIWVKQVVSTREINKLKSIF